ncbi:MAG: 4Fe-4S dicluster domain-containing protein [Chloroflexi bacterium]|nr:4Fe-4S dicluster domain-containing protein [Chloroflexota bacterium]MBI3176988.1 4Fe-4S dicluster domain-containing protein [Chloroflexota bacterium]
MTREILIRDLTKCVVCDVCTSVCRDRHGRARMSLEGPRFGRYQLPNVCRNCPDTPCVNACRLEGMKLHEGRTFVTESCKGCNKCVEACPFDVVLLLPNDHKKKEGFFSKVLGLARTTAPKTITGHVAADAARCVQCGVCGYNCPVGIQVRDYARQGKTVDDPRCVQCGLCIAVCPRGTLRWDIRPQAPTPIFHADKCDLCSGYAHSACVKECPTQALLRVPADEHLLDLNEQLYYEAVGRYLTSPDDWEAA